VAEVATAVPGMAGDLVEAQRVPHGWGVMKAMGPTTRLVGCAVAAAALAGCASAAPPVARPGQVARAGTSAVAGRPAPHRQAPLSPLLAQLSNAQLAGQRVIYSYNGLRPPASLLRLIRHGKAAGVIFFGSNIASKTQIAGVVSRLDKANARASNPLRSIPLLLMTDQEGGEVRRLPGAPLLSEKQIGESGHPAVQAKKAGTGAGKNLASVGMNVNLAPVLDVYRTPGDFDDQFGRSYSRNPKKVSYLGADFITAQQAVGVAATGKHFPGLGAASASQNTDERPVTLNVSKHNLRTIDEFPYKAAISHGVKLVMASWAVYPALDPGRPAGLSRTIVQGELRNRLGFKGVTITDALEAGALRSYGSTAHRATLAARAGMDLILCAAQSVFQGSQARKALGNGLTIGTLGQATFKAAVNRIIALRTSLRH
jgi:beta-N-acetylhexosaminidase